MIRLFINETLGVSKEILLEEKKAHYLVNVMRLKPEDELLVFNGKDGEYKATLNMLSKKKYVVKLIEQTQEQKNKETCILCPAIIKKENMDLVLQKATELGVTDIYPLLTQRCVVRNFNQQRANLIVEEATEQSERLDCPVVHEPCSLAELFKKLPQDTQILFLSERGSSDDFSFKNIQKPAFIIGPEGGFTSQEVEFISKQNNVNSLHLGDTILRAETASIAIVSCWQYRNI